MQHNISHKNKSHLIKQTEEAQKRAKRRLIGSIFLLLLALVILLNVTAKMKPVTVAPTEVQIKNTVAVIANHTPIPPTNTRSTNIANNNLSQQPANSANNSTPILMNQTNNTSNSSTNNSSSNNSLPATTIATSGQQPPQNQAQGNNPSTGSANTVQEAVPSNNGFKAKIDSINNQAVNSNNQTINDNQNNQIDTKASSKNTNNNDSVAQGDTVSANPNPKINMDHLVFTPQIVTTNTKQTLTPEQILNGEDPSVTAKHYYIQLTASKDQNKISQIQANLAKRGINTHVQAVKSGSSTVYRLRIGPFNSHDAAVKSMNSLQQ